MVRTASQRRSSVGVGVLDRSRTPSHFWLGIPFFARLNGALAWAELLAAETAADARSRMTADSHEFVERSNGTER